jgi:hypothetical protein
MWAANNVTGLEVCFALCFALPFLTVWLIVMGNYVNFRWNTGPSALERWAKENGFRIVRRERRTYFRGPFFWGSSNCQIVYRVEVHGPDAVAKAGWVRIGGYWWPSADRIEVRWDEPRPAPRDEGSEPTRGNPMMWDREIDA